MNRIVNTNRLLGCDASNLRINYPFNHKGAEYEIKEVTKHNDDLVVKIWNFDLKYWIKAVINTDVKRIVQAERVD